MTALPHLELADSHSPFDEAVITINGHEEETITIECDGALELADLLIRLVNGQRDAAAVLADAASRLAGEANHQPVTAETAADIARRSL